MNRFRASPLNERGIVAGHRRGPLFQGHESSRSDFVISFSLSTTAAEFTGAERLSKDTDRCAAYCVTAVNTACAELARVLLTRFQCTANGSRRPEHHTTLPTDSLQYCGRLTTCAPRTRLVATNSYKVQSYFVFLVLSCHT